jgi:hypothetical protein
MKCSCCRGSPNLHFTNSADGGVWQKRGQSGNLLYLCVPTVFQIFFKTLWVTDYSSECFCLHKCTNNLLCSFMRYFIKQIFIYCAFVGRELVLWGFVPVFFLFLSILWPVDRHSQKFGMKSYWRPSQTLDF